MMGKCTRVSCQEEMENVVGRGGEVVAVVEVVVVVEKEETERSRGSKHIT